MVKAIKIDKPGSRNIYITVDCFDDHPCNGNEPIRIPVHRVTKSVYKGEYKEPSVVLNGIKWPSFTSYVTNNFFLDN